jgi:hypothetical protein
MHVHTDEPIDRSHRPQFHRRGLDSSEEHYESTQSSRYTSQINSASSARYATGVWRPCVYVVRTCTASVCIHACLF